jgi:hypothetical protein
MTKKELKNWMWQWLSPYADQYKFMDEFDEKLDEYAQSKAKNLPISDVSVSDSEIDELFPFEDESNASPTKPAERIAAYNSRQVDRREGARILLSILHSR